MDEEKVGRIEVIAAVVQWVSAVELAEEEVVAAAAVVLVEQEVVAAAAVVLVEQEVVAAAAVVLAEQEAMVVVDVVEEIEKEVDVKGHVDGSNQRCQREAVWVMQPWEQQFACPLYLICLLAFA